MQPFDKDNNPMDEPTPFDEKKIQDLLDKPKVNHVRVFKGLKIGDELNMKNAKYVVTKLMSGGRAMIKRKA